MATHDWMMGRRAKTVSRLVSFSDRASSTGLDGLSDATMCFAITCVRGWGQEETMTGWIETHNVVCNQRHICVCEHLSNTSANTQAHTHTHTHTYSHNHPCTTQTHIHTTIHAALKHTHSHNHPCTTQTNIHTTTLAPLNHTCTTQTHAFTTQAQNHPCTTQARTHPFTQPPVYQSISVNVNMVQFSTNMARNLWPTSSFPNSTLVVSRGVVPSISSTTVSAFT